MKRRDASPVSLCLEIEQLYTVFCGLSDPVLVLSPFTNDSGSIADFLITYVNKSGSRILKLLPEKIINRKLSEFFPETQNRNLFRDCSKSIKTGIPSTLNSYRLTMNRGRNYSGALASINISQLGDGIALSWKYRQADNSDNAEEQHRITLESIADGFFACNENWNFVYVNAVAERLLGIDRKEVHLKNHWEVFPLTIGTQLEVYYRKAAAGQVVDFENYYEPWDRWFHNRCFPREGGGMSVYFEDITERKRTEQALRESEERFRLLTEVLPIFIWSTDPQENIDFLSGNWREFNQSLALKGHEWNWESSVHPDDLQRTLEAWNYSMRTGNEYKITHRIRRNDGNYYWRFTQASAQKDDAGIIIRWYGISTDIQEQKLLEEKLQKALNELKRSQLRFEKAEALAHVGNWLMNTETGEMEISEELARILAMNPERKKLHSDEFRNFVHPDDKKLFSEVSSRYHKEKKHIDMEYRIIRKDGQVRYIHGISGPEEIEGTAVRYGAAKDITERKTVEIALARERELFESIFNSIPVMITIYDPKLDSFKFNNEYKKILGWKEKDFTCSSLMEKVYPDPLLRKEVTRYMQSLEPGWREFTLMTKDGRCLESSWSNIRLSDNTQIGIGIDLHQIKQTEKKLLESQARLLEAQRIAHIGSFVIDYTETPTRVELTEELYRTFGIDSGKENPDEQLILSRIHPDDLPRVSVRNRTVTDGESYGDVEYRIILPDGTVKYLHTNRIVVSDENGKPLQAVGTTMDITERKLSELKLKSTLGELERSNKDLEQFAYIASHDLQEPLRIVANFARLLEQKYKEKLDEKAGTYINFIVEGTQRMQSLISDLLKYARVTTKANPLVPTDLNHIMKFILIDLKMAIDDQRASVISDKLPEVMADPVQMRQLLQNLISNAIKFRGEDDPQVYIKAERKKKEWVFRIKDNGIGINPQFYGRIFEIFQRLHEREKYTGTGIGLAVCKKIVDRHGGRIWVESEEGKGAAFYFTIPIR